jgi:ankyrin repeat protein
MAMFRAIDSGDVNEVMRLVNTDPSLLEGVDMSRRMWGTGLTPLIHAADLGQLEIVKLLTGKGADIHATTSRAETALHLAAARGHEEVVAYLLDNGAQASHQTQGGHTPLMLAIRYDHTRVALRLLNHMGGHGLEAVSDYERHTALHIAVRWGYTELVTILLDHEARADTTDRYGTSALQTAVYEGHLGIVKLLVDYLGPQALHERDPRRGSILHVALRDLGRRSEKMTMYLLSKGLRPTVRDDHGETALMCGAKWASTKVLQGLLEHTAGQGLNDRFSDGKTALHYAVLRDCHENVRALLLAGADPTIVDDLHMTPRQLADEFKRRKSIAVFKVSTRLVAIFT